MTIRRLSVQLANQIAAGEVVDRQASVVKELLENAVDAGGHKIVLELKGAGRQLIRVRDDGVGIPKDELPLALAPHATSKISTFEDLNAIVTLGFRGEALASIASVSKLTLTSKVKDAENGYSVQVEGPEQVSKIFPAAHLNGTTVDVCELFFNTPARRRFLKSDRTEMMRIKDVFIRCALSHPQLGFELISDAKSIYKVPAAKDEESALKRLAKLLGPDFLRDGIAIRGENPALKISGTLLAPPPIYSSAQDLIYIFLNGRAVSDRMLIHALREGFFESFHRETAVRAVVYLTCDPHEVDVNVHPRKDEVRFHNTTQIHDIFVESVVNALSRYTKEPLTESLSCEKCREGDIEEAVSINNSSLPSFPKGLSFKVPEKDSNNDRVIKHVFSENKADDLKKTEFFKKNVALGNKAEKFNVRSLNEIEIKPEYSTSLFQFLDEPVAGVCLVRSDKRFFLVKEQSLLNKTRIDDYIYDVNNNSVKSASMMMPFAVKIEPLVIKALKTAQDEAKRCGFEIELKRNMVSLKSIPDCIRGCDLAEYAPKILSLIAVSKESLQRGECPSSLALEVVSGFQPLILNPDKIQSLLNSLSSIDDLLSLGADCHELPINLWAMEFLGKS